MSGGGGSSGSVNYPSYMKYMHDNWMTGADTRGGGLDTMTSSVVDLMNAAMRDSLVTVTTSPYNALTATNPDDTFFNAGDTISSYRGQSAYKLLALFLAETPEALYTAYATDAAATAMIAAFTTDLDAQYNNTIIPSLAAGYADLNAQMSSALTIATAGVASQKTKEVAKFTGQIKTSIALQRSQMKMEWRKSLSTFSLENSRIYLAAKHEEDESNTDYETKNALWDLELYQYGTQVLASIAGTATQKVPSHKPSVLGAGLSGAAAGAMVGSQITTGAGGADAGTATLAGAIIGSTLGIASAL